MGPATPLVTTTKPVGFVLVALVFCMKEYVGLVSSLFLVVLVIDPRQLCPSSFGPFMVQIDIFIRSTNVGFGSSFFFSFSVFSVLFLRDKEQANRTRHTTLHMYRERVHFSHFLALTAACVFPLMLICLTAAILVRAVSDLAGSL